MTLAEVLQMDSTVIAIQGYMADTHVQHMTVSCDRECQPDDDHARNNEGTSATAAGYM